MALCPPPAAEGCGRDPRMPLAAGPGWAAERLRRCPRPAPPGRWGSKLLGAAAGLSSIHDAVLPTVKRARHARGESQSGPASPREANPRRGRRAGVLGCARRLSPRNARASTWARRPALRGGAGIQDGMKVEDGTGIRDGTRDAGTRECEGRQTPDRARGWGVGRRCGEVRGPGAGGTGQRCTGDGEVAKKWRCGGPRDSETRGSEHRAGHQGEQRGSARCRLWVGGQGGDTRGFVRVGGRLETGAAWSWSWNKPPANSQPGVGLKVEGESKFGEQTRVGRRRG